MRTEEEIRSTIRLHLAYAEQAKEAALSTDDVEYAAQKLRERYDWRIRAAILDWVLNDPATEPEPASQ